MIWNGLIWLRMRFSWVKICFWRTTLLHGVRENRYEQRLSEYWRYREEIRVVQNLRRMIWLSPERYVILQNWWLRWCWWWWW